MRLYGAFILLMLLNKQITDAFHVPSSPRLLSPQLSAAPQTHRDGKADVKAIPSLVLLPNYIQDAAARCFGEDFRHIEPELYSHTKFGDFQCNLPFMLAKQIHQTPFNISHQLVDALMNVTDFAALADVDIHPKGFINFRLKSDFVVSELHRMKWDRNRKLGVPLANRRKRFVVDYSSPNLVKQLHVGHLRSIIIGDAICKLLEFVGHSVIRTSHVGDWGLQFGKLFAEMNESMPHVFMKGNNVAEGELTIEAIEKAYEVGTAGYAIDEETRKSAHRFLKKLQLGDPEVQAVWEATCNLSRQTVEELYRALYVKGLTEKGESFYKHLLPNLITRLNGAKSLVSLNGTKCVRLPGSTGNESAVAIQRSDGTYLYAAIDIAAVMYRCSTEKADVVLYVTDESQSYHLKQVFAVCRVLGLVPASVELLHIPFGFVVSMDGKKLKTRAGKTVKLKALLSEAVDAAEKWLRQRNDTHIDNERDLMEAARVIGIGALKYNDLSMNRLTKYKCDFKKMLNISGNTITYLLYALARARGIQRRIREMNASGKALNAVMHSNVSTSFQHVATNEEGELAKHIIKFPSMIHSLADSLKLQQLPLYLYRLGKLFNRFYEKCPVSYTFNGTRGQETHESRVLLCELTAQALELGLGLLGIRATAAL